MYEHTTGFQFLDLLLGIIQIVLQNQLVPSSRAHEGRHVRHVSFFLDAVQSYMRW
jgi:hypothetical protein